MGGMGDGRSGAAARRGRAVASLRAQRRGAHRDAAATRVALGENPNRNIITFLTVLATLALLQRQFKFIV